MRSATQRFVLPLGFVLLGGCGPSVEPGSMCNDDGLTRLVQLDEGPSALANMWGVRDDRGWLLFDGRGAEGRNLAVECGEPPRVFAYDLPVVFRLDLRGPWLGYDLSFGPARLFALDPWGESPPRRLPPYLLGLIDDGVLLGDSTESEGVSLWYAKFGTTFEVEPVPLDLHVPEGKQAFWTGFPPIRDPVDLVFVRVDGRDEQTTFGFDPRTGERRFFEAKPMLEPKMGGRFAVLWELPPGEPAHTIVVDTRNPSRRSTPTALPSASRPETPDTGVYHQYDRDDIIGTLIITLPELRELWLEGEWTTWGTGGAAPDGRRVLQGPGGLYLLEPGSSTPRLVHPHHGSSIIVGNDLWVMHTAWPEPHRSTPHDRALVRVALDGSGTTTVLEPPLESWLQLSRGRWALTRDGRDDLTDLRIYDPATGREEVVAEGIDREFARWNHGGLATQHSLGPHDDLDPFWPVRASDTLRTGVVEGDDILFAQTFEDRPIVWRLTP